MRALLRTLVFGGLLLGLHRVGLGLMDDHRAMEVVLSPGTHTDPVMLGMALAFLGLRFFIILIFPGVLAVRLLHVAWPSVWTGPDQRAAFTRAEAAVSSGDQEGPKGGA